MSAHARAGKIAAVVCAAVWHLGFDLTSTLANWAAYGPWRIPVATAWAVHLVVGVLASWTLLARDRVPALWSLYALLALAVDVTLMAATAPGGLVGPANWGWGSVGWLGCLIFWRRRQAELVAFLAANAALMVAALALAQSLDQASVAKFLMVIAGSVTLQLGYSAGAHALEANARRAIALSESRAELAAAGLAAEAVHADLLERQRAVRDIAADLLTELSERADPGEEELQARCAVAASRLRRLMAEGEEASHPLLNELGAGVLDAERRGLRVAFEVAGDPPPLDVEVRRALVGPPADLLARARPGGRARVTVAAADDEVTVSVLAVARETTPEHGHPDVETHQDTAGGSLWITTRWIAR